MPRLTKYPEGVPVDIAIDKIAAYHTWSIGEDMCVKIRLVGGDEIHVTECMADIRSRLPSAII